MSATSSPFVPRTLAVRARVPSLVDVTLDDAQRAAIELPRERALLVLGEAGHGKTTVLLHRVARLWEESGHTLRAVVLVPSEGLVRLMVPLLRRMGVDIDVMTFDRFLSKQGRRAFRRLPKESDLTPANVMRLKRSDALRIAIDEIAARDAGLIDDDEDARKKPTGARVSRGDLQHLFGDRVLMERVAAAGHLPASVVRDVLDRTRIQFQATTEREWSHVTDRDRLVAVDHRTIDEGTASEHAWSVDVEDYPVLFALDRLRALRRRETPVSPRIYDLIAIDEAQELAPLELELMGRCLAPGGALVVSGDADQHTDETSNFLGWDGVMQALGAPAFATTTLEIGYRCPPEVVALARGVRDGALAQDAEVLTFASLRDLATTLGPALGRLLDADEAASIAVVCRRPDTVRKVAAALRGKVPARVVFDGKFLPRGPAQVTLVSEVKGLEFDYVLVPDAHTDVWPDDAAARRAMYVAITRARQQVVLACVGQRSAILAGAAERSRRST